MNPDLPLPAAQRPICRGSDLADSGGGVRFEELDWRPGMFFDGEGLLLVCSTHGVLYEPGSGRCLGGPCANALVPLALAERQGMVYLKG